MHLNMHRCEYSGLLKHLLPVKLTSLLLPLLSLVHPVKLFLVELVLHDLLFFQETLIAFGEDMRRDTTRHELFFIQLKLFIMLDKTWIFLWKFVCWAFVVDLILLNTYTIMYLLPWV